MANENYTPLSKSVGGILGDIENNDIAIPEIQRPFVWDKTQVRDLMDSLYKGYPTGYLIIWRNPNVRLKDGKIASGKKIVIDGQQRITALMTAVAGKEIINSDYKKGRIKIAFNPFLALNESDDTSCFEVQTAAHLKDKKWISDISEIFKKDFSTYQFIKTYCDNNPEMKDDDLDKILTSLRNISNRQLGVIELSEHLEIDVVTDIFIRINSKGTKLDQSDFVMSKIAADEVHGGTVLRKAIDYFAHLSISPQDYDTIMDNDTEFQGSEYYSKITWLKNDKEEVFDPGYDDVIRVAFMTEYSRAKLADLVALLSGRDFEEKTYKAEIIDDTYTKLKDGVKRVINKDNFQNFMQAIRSAGFISNKLVSSKMALDFAYTLYLRLKDDSDVNLSEKKRIVQKWYVLSVLTGRYSSSPESAFYTDLRLLNEKGAKTVLQDIESATLSDNFWNVMIPQKLETTSNTNPILQVYIAAQVFNNEKSLLSNSVGVRDLVEIIGDVHHVFPKAYLKRNGLNKSKYNQNANYALLDTQVNKDISADPPCAYFKKAFEQCETKNIQCGSITDLEKLKENLKTNCIPENIVEMDYTRFDEFLASRRLMMAMKIKDYYYNI